MAIPRRLVAGLLGALLLVLTPSAIAYDGHNVEVTHSVEHVSFTILPGTDPDPATPGCHQINTTINGEGERSITVRTTTYPDGSRQIIDDGVAAGTATDSEGRRYHWTYKNRAIISIPPEGPLVIVEMKDVFKLRGGERENHIDARFHWIWTFEPADVDAVKSGLDVVFPPADNWIQLRTTGKPLACDPI